MEKLGYKRPETDAEFLARIREKYSWFCRAVWSSEPKGEELDERAWDSLHMQRKIVEVFP